MCRYEYSDDYPTCVETHSSLRIFSDKLHPDEITAVLGLQPTNSFAKDEVFGKANRKRKATGWFYSSEHLVSSRDTRRHLDELLAALEGKDGAVNTLIEKDCELDISSYWVSIGHGGPVIEPEQMARLGHLKIAVWWDVYFDRNDAEET